MNVVMVNGEHVFDESKVVKDNAMLKHRPELFLEWDFEKNDELELDVYEITFGTHKKVWWICPKCKSSYDIETVNRTKNNCGCPYCAGKRVNHTNSLACLRPDIATEWHPTLNGELTPKDVTSRSGEKVWWLAECGHYWDAVIGSRTAGGSGCRYCANSNPSVLVGFNDMWTANPELASMLADPEDGYKYTQSSGKKVDWKCPECGQLNKNKSIDKVFQSSLCCKFCSDGFKFPEKFMCNLLMQLNVDFVYQKKFSWLPNKIYDFFIPSLNIIIEIHGGQHYKQQGYKSLGGRTLEEEQKNDEIKKLLAEDNGIEEYIIIDARSSTLDYIKSSIELSNIAKIYSLEKINWNDIVFRSNSSKLVEVCKFYSFNKEKYNLKEIAYHLDIDLSTLRDYLKRGKELDLCDYKANDQKRKWFSNKSRIRSVVQLDINGNYIKTWRTIGEVARGFNKNDASVVSGVCRGRLSKAYGFKWMYKEDYDKMLKESLTHQEYMNKYYPKQTSQK